jgi:hypothetical protein
MVENVPRSLRQNDKLKAFFSNLFPNEVVLAHVSVKANKLDALVQKREMLVKQLEAEIAIHYGNAKMIPNLNEGSSITSSYPPQPSHYYLL